MLIVAGALGLWLVLVVLVLAALRAAALADLEESRRTGRRPGHGRPQAAAALVAVALSPGVPAQADAAKMEAGCDDRGAGSGRQQPALDVTLCLINEVRSRRNVPVLHAEPRLARAAHRHAVDMERHGYFSHVSLGGRTLVDRLRRARYIPRHCAWHVGEALAWGSHAAATPASRVRAWMHSRRHRKVLVDPDYREAGIGIADGAGDRVVYDATFGRRRCP